MSGTITLLDAAMGTALRARGLPFRALPEEWLLERPQEVAAIHGAHRAAGAEILLSCSFNCTEPRLAPHGLALRLEELCQLAYRLARSAGPRIRVAGCVGPTGLVKPGLETPPAMELREHFDRPFRALREAGAELLWSETHYALDEARAALLAGRRTGLPVVITMAFAELEQRLRCPDGSSAKECLRALAAEGAAAVGVNCVEPTPALMALIQELVRELSVPIAVKPNAGIPGAILEPAPFAAALAPIMGNGTLLVGGCCGTTADHLRVLRTVTPRVRPAKR